MGFRGEYGFLSNFYNCCIEYEGKVYPSVENAFKASKTLSGDERDIYKMYSNRSKKDLDERLRLETIGKKLECL